MKTKFTIRTECEEDIVVVNALILRAFEEGPRGYSGESELVKRLRASDAFFPSLSMVATQDEIIVGHILLTRVFINAAERIPTLILAPVSVLPEFQNRGIGGALIEAAHREAKNMDEKHVFLLGHATYYPKFGYAPSRNFDVLFPKGMDTDNCMAIELEVGSLDKVSGTLEYSKAFDNL